MGIRVFVGNKFNFRILFFVVGNFFDLVVEGRVKVRKSFFLVGEELLIGYVKGEWVG